MIRMVIGSFLFLIASFDVFPMAHARYAPTARSAQATTLQAQTALTTSASTRATTPVAEASSSDDDLNRAACAMAGSNLQLDDALKYSEKAVKNVEDATSKIDLDDLTSADLRNTQQLAACWDTLGWIYFQKGDFDSAEKYVDAAWQLGSDAVVGDHLGQIYEKEGKEQKAIMVYETAAAGAQGVAHAKERLQSLSDVESDDYTPIIVEDAQKLRTFKVQVAEKPKEHASVEFFMLFSAGGNVAGVKILGDAGAIPGAEDALRSAKFDVTFPDDGQEKILRRGVLDCEPEIPGCTVALMRPQDVRSVK